MPRYVTEQWNAMLKLLADRNGSAELSRQCAEDKDGPPVSYRTRLFMVKKDGSIIVERPQQAMLDRSFGVGDDIELLLSHNNERLVATCTIHEVFMHLVNTELKTCCYRLSEARRPQRDQRRAFYRVGIAALDLPMAVLRHEVEPEGEPDDAEAPVERRTTDDFEFKARMVNLSAGGLGLSVRLSRKVLNQIKRTRDYQATLDFGDGEVVETPICVAHVSTLGDDGLYLGVQFDQPTEDQQEALEDRMHQLCMQFQRQALRRKRA